MAALLIGQVSACGPSKFEVVEIASAEVSPNKIGPCEPSIAINRKKPKNLVVGNVLNGVNYSNDGGKTWTNGTLISPYGVWGDPVLLSDTNGHIHYFHLSDPTGKNWKSDSILDRIVCQTSYDGGNSWTEGTYMGLNYPKQQDKEWACLNPETNALYVSWTQFDKYKSEHPDDKSHIMFSQSLDGGITWESALQISQHGGNCLDDSKTAEGAVPAVGINGEIFVVWSRNDSLWLSTSLDGGNSFAPETFVTTQPGGWSFAVEGIRRCNGFPVLVVDRSNGPSRGKLHLNWADQRFGYTEVFYASSSDGGKTWSDPKTISGDVKGDRFFTWMNIDQNNGNLYAVYYDRRNHSDSQTDVYLSYSKDAGESWKEVRISQKSFSPSTSFFFGDYNHIDVFEGKIYPVWTAMEDGRLKIYIALIDDKQLK
ncbi:MAG: exo-alpha-sialidase [Cryomorphaceae bacterium]|nr:exo-alpha-sialidase [Cryomorphaceae bacterium]